MNEEQTSSATSDVATMNRSSPSDIVWWVVLAVSCVIGFGMTAFAPV
jgi:hypothetical protein